MINSPLPDGAVVVTFVAVINVSGSAPVVDDGFFGQFFGDYFMNFFGGNRT